MVDTLKSQQTPSKLSEIYDYSYKSISVIFILIAITLSLLNIILSIVVSDKDRFLVPESTEKIIFIVWGLAVILSMVIVVPKLIDLRNTLYFRSRLLIITWSNCISISLGIIFLGTIFFDMSNCDYWSFPLTVAYTLTILAHPLRVLRLIKVFGRSGGIEDPMSTIDALLAIQDHNSDSTYQYDVIYPDEEQQQQHQQQQSLYNQTNNITSPSSSIHNKYHDQPSLSPFSLLNYENYHVGITTQWALGMSALVLTSPPHLRQSQILSPLASSPNRGNNTTVPIYNVNTSPSHENIQHQQSDMSSSISNNNAIDSTDKHDNITKQVEYEQHIISQYHPSLRQTSYIPQDGPHTNTNNQYSSINNNTNTIDGPINSLDPSYQTLTVQPMDIASHSTRVNTTNDNNDDISHNQQRYGADNTTYKNFVSPLAGSIGEGGPGQLTPNAVSRAQALLSDPHSIEANRYIKYLQGAGGTESNLASQAFSDDSNYYDHDINNINDNNSISGMTTSGLSSSQHLSNIYIPRFGQLSLSQLLSLVNRQETGILSRRKARLTTHLGDILGNTSDSSAAYFPLSQFYNLTDQHSSSHGATATAHTNTTYGQGNNDNYPNIITPQLINQSQYMRMSYLDPTDPHLPRCLSPSQVYPFTATTDLCDECLCRYAASDYIHDNTLYSFYDHSCHLKSIKRSDRLHNHNHTVPSSSSSSPSNTTHADTDYDSDNDDDDNEEVGNTSPQAMTSLSSKQKQHDSESLYPKQFSINDSSSTGQFDLPQPSQQHTSPSVSRHPSTLRKIASSIAETSNMILGRSQNSNNNANDTDHHLLLSSTSDLTTHLASELSSHNEGHQYIDLIHMDQDSLALSAQKQRNKQLKKKKKKSSSSPSPNNSKNIILSNIDTKYHKYTEYTSFRSYTNFRLAILGMSLALSLIALFSILKFVIKEPQYLAMTPYMCYFNSPYDDNSDNTDNLGYNNNLDIIFNHHLSSSSSVSYTSWSSLTIDTSTPPSSSSSTATYTLLHNPTIPNPSIMTPTIAVTNMVLHLSSCVALLFMYFLIDKAWGIYSIKRELVILIALDIAVITLHCIFLATGHTYSFHLFVWVTAARLTTHALSMVIGPLFVKVHVPQAVIDSFIEYKQDKNRLLSESSSDGTNTTNNNKNNNTTSSSLLPDQPVSSAAVSFIDQDFRIHSLINHYIDKHMHHIYIYLKYYELGVTYDPQGNAIFSSYHNNNITIPLSSVYESSNTQYQLHLGEIQDAIYNTQTTILSLQGTNQEDNNTQFSINNVFELSKDSYVDIVRFNQIKIPPPPRLDILLSNPLGYASFLSFLSTNNSQHLLSAYMHLQGIIIYIHHILTASRHIIIQTYKDYIYMKEQYNSYSYSTNMISKHSNNRRQHGLFSPSMDNTSSNMDTSDTNPNTQQQSPPPSTPPEPSITPDFFLLIISLHQYTQSFCDTYFSKHYHYTDAIPLLPLQLIQSLQLPYYHTHTTYYSQQIYPLHTCISCCIQSSLSGSFNDAVTSLYTFISAFSRHIFGDDISHIGGVNGNNTNNNHGVGGNNTTIDYLDQIYNNNQHSSHHLAGIPQEKTSQIFLQQQKSINNSIQQHQQHQQQQEWSNILQAIPSSVSSSHSIMQQYNTKISTPIPSSRFNTLPYPQGPGSFAHKIPSLETSSLVGTIHPHSLLPQLARAPSRYNTSTGTSLVGSHYNNPSSAHMLSPHTFGTDSKIPKSTYNTNNNDHNNTNKAYDDNNIVSSLLSPSSSSLGSYQIDGDNNSSHQNQSFGGSIYKHSDSNVPSSYHGDHHTSTTTSSHTTSSDSPQKQQSQNDQSSPAQLHNNTTIPWFSRCVQNVSTLIDLLHKVNEELINALASHHIVYGQSIQWKFMYYRIAVTNRWVGLLHACDMDDNQD